MSDYKHWVGKLVKVDKSAEEILAELYPNVEYGDGYTAKEALRDEGYEGFVIISGDVYSVVKQEKDPYDDILNARHEHDGTISFEVKYYNGGGRFSDAIAETFKKKKI